MFTFTSTGHEHLDGFGLINMNGRVYDPVLARFLSPDPIVQAPGYGQSYNRYSYCWNNPLAYTDPSGYKVHWYDEDGNSYINTYGNIFGVGYTSGNPGSGNHWSDKYRSEYQMYMLSSISTFNNFFGKGASDIAQKLVSNPVSLSAWQKGLISIDIVRNTSGNPQVGPTDGLPGIPGISVVENQYGKWVYTKQGKWVLVAGRVPQGGGDDKFFEADVRFIPEFIPYNSYFAGAINTQKSTYEGYQKHGLNSYWGKLLMHEFGHYLQNKYGGSLWYNLNVVPTSAININLDENKANSYYLYNRTWTEVQANTMSYYYFNYPSFWDFNNYPVNFNYINDELKSKLYYHK